MDAVDTKQELDKGRIHSTRNVQLEMALTLDPSKLQRSSVMRNLNDALLNPRIYFHVLILIVLLSALTPLSATTTSSLTITVVNNSSREIRRLYLSPVDNDNWGPDQLDESSISPGATRTLNVSWDQSTVKLVAEDQDGCFMYMTVQASGNPVWTITSDTTRNCGN